jgi:hypothetical protein
MRKVAAWPSKTVLSGGLNSCSLLQAIGAQSLKTLNPGV